MGVQKGSRGRGKGVEVGMAGHLGQECLGGPGKVWEGGHPQLPLWGEGACAGWQGTRKGEALGMNRGPPILAVSQPRSCIHD